MTSARLRHDIPLLTAAVSRVPAALKTFAVPTARARMYGLTPQVMSSLVEAGLPYAVADDGGLLFAHADLHYIGLRLGTFLAHLKAMAQWTSTLNAITDGVNTSVQLKYFANPAHAPAGSGCLATILLPDSRTVCRHLLAGKPAATIEWTPRTDWPELDSASLPILEEIGGLDFYLVPPGLVHDISFARSTGLGDCGSGARLLVDRLSAAGFEARVAYGLLVSVPFSAYHIWSELRVGPDWVPVDPLLLTSMHRFSGLHPEQWPCWRSPGCVLLKLGSNELPPISVAGAGIEASFRTAFST